MQQGVSSYLLHMLHASAVLQDEVHAQTCGGPDPVFVTHNCYTIASLYQTTKQRAPPTGTFHCHNFYGSVYNFPPSYSEIRV